MNGVATNQEPSQSQELTLTLVHFLIYGPYSTQKALPQRWDKCFQKSAKEYVFML